MYQIDPLAYAYDALSPYIDPETMELHHDKHHAKYAENLNAAIEKYPDFASHTLDQLLINLDQIPEEIRSAVRNNGGGVWNHNHFWKSMTPQSSGNPVGEVSSAIEARYGSFSQFQSEFSEAATKLFGSGWAWLVLTPEAEISIQTTANQDCPISHGNKPLLSLDVWEHAYYLKYQNRRADYIAAWWNVVNWDLVEELYQSGKAIL